jgi:hypothetical protein
MVEKRRSPRIDIEDNILLSHPDVGTLCLKTRDVSDGGVYLFTKGFPLPEGTEVTLQSRDMPDAPQVPALICRRDDQGIGLQFLMD